MDDRRLIIFFRRFARGIKSRIGETLGYPAAVKLYRSMLRDLKRNLDDLTVPVIPMADGPGELFWPGSLVQSGEDLGVRMENAFRLVFKEGEYALLIGSDIPHITVPLIKTAFHSLQRSDMVIGPAEDGGYYLIGFTRSGFYRQYSHGRAALFTDMEWSTETVFMETVKRAEIRGLKRSELIMLRDLDTAEDVRQVLNSEYGKYLPAVRLDFDRLTGGSGGSAD